MLIGEAISAALIAPQFAGHDEVYIYPALYLERFRAVPRSAFGVVLDSYGRRSEFTQLELQLDSWEVMEDVPGASSEDASDS
jgi:hypothetical protein